MSTSAVKAGSDVPPPLEDLIERADAVRPLLEECAAEGESRRRLADPVIPALREAGLVRLGTPQRFGGWATDFRTLIEVGIALGRGDGSASWVANLLNGASYMVGLLDERAQSEVWAQAGPDVGISACFTPSAQTRKVGDDYVVSGRWGWATGCLWADWSLLAIPLVDTEAREEGTGLALVPMSELTVEDTWFVSGMCATGSNHLVGEELLIPSYRVLPLREAGKGIYPNRYSDEAMYRSFFGSVDLFLAGPLIGLGQAALEYVVGKAPRRGITYTSYETQTDSVGFQEQIAEAAVRLDTAHLHVVRSAETIDSHARAGEIPDLRTRARTRMDNGWIATQACAAVDTLVTAHGASAFASSSPLQRIWRDLNAVARHGAINPAIGREIYGRTLLGLDPFPVSDQL